MTALVVIMLSMGLQVTFDAVVASARSRPRVTLALVANYVLVPAATVGLSYLSRPDPLVSLGFLILAVSPGAPVAPQRRRSPATTSRGRSG